MSFADLKRSASSNFTKLNEQLSKLNSSSKGNAPDERIWAPEVDAAGNGYAVFRFLPPKAGEDLPFIRIFDHGFKGPTGLWYIEKSLTTLGEADPVGELNGKLWNSGVESDKAIAREQKRRLSYYSNIYMIQDSKNPANNGKVFLYKYGKKIFDKLNDLMVPQFEDETPVNPFDFWTGANFKLKIRTVDDYRNYDKSEFDTPAPLFDDDLKLEEVYNSIYSLQELLDRKNFKTYDELSAKLNRVLNLTGKNEETLTSSLKREKKEEWTPSEPAKTFKEAPEPKISSVDDDDDDLAFFKNLADDDDTPF